MNTHRLCSLWLSMLSLGQVESCQLPDIELTQDTGTKSTTGCSSGSSVIQHQPHLMAVAKQVKAAWGPDLGPLAGVGSGRQHQQHHNGHIQPTCRARTGGKQLSERLRCYWKCVTQHCHSDVLQTHVHAWWGVMLLSATLGPGNTSA